MNESRFREFSKYIRVSQSVSLGAFGRTIGEYEPVTINWSALGSVDIATAREFMEQLAAAIEQAEAWQADSKGNNDLDA